MVKDANEILSSDRIFKPRGRDTFAEFSNIFRYKLLHEKGGVWVDSDIVCLKSFDFKAEHVIASQFKPKSSFGCRRRQATNCVLKAPKGSKLMEYCYQMANNKSPEQLKWGDTGPNLVHYLVNKFNYRKSVVNPNVFCPVNFWDWQILPGSTSLGEKGIKLKQIKYELKKLWHPPLTLSISGMRCGAEAMPIKMRSIPKIVFMSN